MVPLEHPSAQPLYTPSDLDAMGFDHERDLGSPGEYPYTRGINPGGYRSAPPIVGQYAGVGDAADTNRIWRGLLATGATGLYIALDLPTQLGYDSDHPLAAGEVGRVGVAIDSLADVETLFDGIPIRTLRAVSTTGNAIAPVALALFIGVCERQGVDPATCRFSLQNDILKEYVARGAYIYPPRPGVKLTVDVAEYCARHLPTWRPLTLCGSHIRGAGADGVQEAAFALANGLVYLRELLARGLTVDEAVRDWEIQLALQMKLLEEVARFRAVRRLWARLMAEEFGAKTATARRLFLRTPCSGVTMTAQQPLNNIVRSTVEVLAGLLGGAQHLRAYPYDEALGLPTPESQATALRTQQILMEETDVAATADPLGGSYYVEALTSEIESRIRAYLAEVDRLGGGIAAIEKGYYEEQISESAYRHQLAVESGDLTIVGVNKYQTTGKPSIQTLKVDPTAERRQIERLLRLRRERDGRLVRERLAAVAAAARTGENSVPTVLEAVRAYCTVGEICDVFREIYGEYR